jgi:putative membrane protein
MAQVIAFFTPLEFSPTVVVAFAVPAAAYLRGIVLARRAGEYVGFWRPAAFFLGAASMYLVLHTYVDYLAAHMFWVHRLQHLVLHHVGPFLIALSLPFDLMARGTPQRLRTRLLLPLWRHRATRTVYRLVQNPVVAPVLFVGLIYFWLTPSIHFAAMLNADYYRLMNWSMAVDGLLFWWLMLAPLRAQGHAAVPYLLRVVILWSVLVLQIIPGAYIGLHRTILYDVYNICGRAWPIDPITDQQIGGLITWIPASMMSVLGILVVVRYILQDRRDTRVVFAAATTH